MRQKDKDVGFEGNLSVLQDAAIVAGDFLEQCPVV